MVTRFIYLFLAMIFLMPTSLADSEISVDIKNPSQETVKYSNIQKAIMHLHFAKVYSINLDWEKYYKHILSVYAYCPALNGSKFYIIRSKNKKILPEDLINPDIIKKLNKLGINNIFTKDDSINLLELISPLLEQRCKN